MKASATILVSLAVSLLSSLAAQQPPWPLLIDSFPRLDTTRRVQLPSGRSLYRANITLRFKEGVSDSAKLAFFSRHGMTVGGVTRSGKFFVGIPDPGPTLDSLMARLQRLRTEPEIRFGASLDFSPLEPVRDPRPAAAAPVLGSLARLLHEENSGLKDPVRTVIRDSSAWQEWWRRVTADHLQAVPVPSVDFHREMVILVGLGPQQSTGYDVRVMSARHVGATLQIRVQVSLLGLGPCMAGRAVTSPVDVIRIPRSGGVVTFLDESFQQDCR